MTFAISDQITHSSQKVKYSVLFQVMSGMVLIVYW